MEDLNDNAPAFVSQDVRVTVPQRSEAGMTVAAAAAVDRDSARYSGLTFSFAPDSARGPWSIDSETGVVTTSVSGQILPTQTILKVKVQDSGGLAPTVPMSIRILATDSLRFSKSLYTWTVEEGVVKDLGNLTVVGSECFGLRSLGDWCGA